VSTSRKAEALGNRFLLFLPFLIALASVPAAAADNGEERALAERHAPVVRLVEQEEACGYGEPYVPLDVDVLFDEPTVALRGPWGTEDLIRIAPSAEDLSEGLYEHHLDFPGDALDPRCDYERWSDRVAREAAPTVYAHVATDRHPGRDPPLPRHGVRGRQDGGAAGPAARLGAGRRARPLGIGIAPPSDGSVACRRLTGERMFV
jgi:hypothetical protein